jgi:hypothetical protein
MANSELVAAVAALREVGFVVLGGRLVNPAQVGVIELTPEGPVNIGVAGWPKGIRVTGEEARTLWAALGGPPRGDDR